jgi:hypothetical protein
MGNRATIIFEQGGGDPPSPAVYLHWNGGPESVYGFLEEMQTRGHMRSDYAAARFIGVVSDFFMSDGGEGLSLGVFAGPSEITPEALEKVPTDHGDNGFYVVKITGDVFAVRRFTETERRVPCKPCGGTGRLSRAALTSDARIKGVAPCWHCNSSGNGYEFPLIEWGTEAVKTERRNAERHAYRAGFREKFNGLRAYRAGGSGWLATLETIAALQTEEPEYEEWGGDTEEAEQWGIAAGQFAAAEIARKAIKGAEK